MGCFQPDAPKNINYADQLTQTLTAQIGLQPALINAESQFNPLETNLTLGNLNNLLFGSAGGSFDVQHYTPAIFQSGNKLSYGNGIPKGFTGVVDTPPLPMPGQRGGASGMTFDAATGLPIRSAGGNSFAGLTGSDAGDAALMASVGPFAALFGSDDPTRVARPQQWTETKSLGPQRGLLDIMNEAAAQTEAGQIGRLNELGPQAHDAILAANPEMAALLAELNSQANTDLAAGSSLTPEEQRLTQQSARASWAARGLDGSNAAAADEVLRNFALGQNLQGQRRGFAQNVVGLDQMLVQNPVLAMILANSGAVPQAQSLMPGPLFNPESPFAGNIAAANQQMKALFADPSTLSKINQTTQTTGNILGTFANFAGGMAGI